MITTREHGPVTQIKMSRFAPGTSVSAYLVDGLLVDSGLAYTAEELAGFLASREVHGIVNTHYHEDHIGGNATVTERCGAKALAHPLALEKMARRPHLFPYQEESWGYPAPCTAEAIGESVSTAHYRFNVVHTPGHSPDHICLHEPELGWLFTGDLFISTHPRVARPEEDQWQIIQSLRKIAVLKPRLLFTAPSNVVTEPERVLAETIAYLEQLGARIAGLRARGLTAEQTAREIFGEEGPVTAMTQGQFSAANLVRGFGGG